MVAAAMAGAVATAVRVAAVDMAEVAATGEEAEEEAEATFNRDLE